MANLDTSETTAGNRRRVHTEVERKYDVDADRVMPRLDGTGPVVTARQQEPFVLRAQYFDTADRVLSRARITLRRREGGADEGWHIKLPAAVGRTEIQTPLTASHTVPTEVRESVFAWIGRAPLESLAELETSRQITRVADADGRVLAEIADDLVTAYDQRIGRQRCWREWEVELVDTSGDEGEAIFAAIEERLSAAGARPAATASKLARATGGPTVPRGSEFADGREVTLAALRGLVAEFRAIDGRVGRGDAQAVYSLHRKTCRLRAVLAASRSILQPAATDPIRAQLRWLEDALAAAVEGELLVARLHQDLAPDDAAASGLAATLLGESERSSVLARKRVSRIVRGERYRALLGAVDALLAAPPLTAGAQQSVTILVRNSIRADYLRALRASRHAAHSSGQARHDLRRAALRLHDVVLAWRVVVPDVCAPEQRRAGELGWELAEAVGEERAALVACELLEAEVRRPYPAGVFAKASDLSTAWINQARRARSAATAAERALTTLVSSFS
ncbi:CYTH and CHAD domain-containing protein [Rathayibacter toxicus]|uniref:CYTH and CHAD domain-containing protein n=1 Tax=Rathayibacter toxicus TaxID=145458 RepID=UPI000CE8378B|nr:CYTH and CHAD domain-containing protein [Rathayibacter toxicus]PPI54186.1 hypothetical protein C5D35_07635 [Rathayibacter toxicus]QOD11116.1 CYTH and CHAD domain-containing protein [Rathayibacter toxicus]QWL27859.1 CYTH and CHAD domain-containing protein [Rathayibacter toxicus]QWL29975.1 CYTH and CHAD domain-containing protein [Rathayibacter toxicus]QWL32067.1 CYTH and CHAD domain-containing protein [Rathayibacter toxicus]